MLRMSSPPQPSWQRPHLEWSTAELCSLLPRAHNQGLTAVQSGSLKNRQRELSCQLHVLFQLYFVHLMLLLTELPSAVQSLHSYLRDERLCDLCYLLSTTTARFQDLQEQQECQHQRAETPGGHAKWTPDGQHGHSI